MSAHDRSTVDPLRLSLIGVTIAQLAIGVLGVLLISNEYSSGTIRTTLAAVPNRLPVLWAKAGIFSVVTFGLMLPASVIGFVGAQASLRGHTVDGHDISVSLSDPGVARALIGSAIYLTLSGLIAMGLGANPSQHRGRHLGLRGAVLPRHSPCQRLADELAAPALALPAVQRRRRDHDRRLPRKYARTMDRARGTRCVHRRDRRHCSHPAAAAGRVTKTRRAI
jgi:hypothetical protein